VRSYRYCVDGVRSPWHLSPALARSLPRGRIALSRLSQVVVRERKRVRNLPRLMDVMTEFVSPLQRKAQRRIDHLVTAALVAAVATLAACGASTSPSPVSNVQTAVNDVNAGLSAQAAGRLSDAATDYQNAIAHDAHNKFGYYDLGLVHELTGQETAAEANYRAAIQIDPNFVPALYNLAILRTTPSPSEAEELYRHVISLQPNDAAAHLNLGFLLRSEKRIAEGNAELTTAVTLDPSIASRIPPGTLNTPAPATPKPSPTR
jgi:tetratricopeptide (TPR) repeat protein